MLAAISFALATPPTGTYQGCEFPPVLSVTASTANTAKFAPRRAVVVGGDLIVGGYIVGSETETLKDLTIAGPFTAADPSGTSATSEHEDIVTSEPGDAGLVMINTATGAPSGMLHIRGAGDDYIYGLSAGGPGGTVLGIGGDFSGNISAITSSCTPVTWPAGETVACNAGATTLTITPTRADAYSSHLISMNKDGTINWLRGAWPSNGENLVGGTRVDSTGNVYAVGYFCKPPVAGQASGTEYCKSCEVVCSAIVAKFKANDGSLLWKKEYPELEYASQLDIDEADDALYFSGEMYNGAGSAITSTPLDVDIQCAEHASKNCAMLARISLTDGATQWVRLVHGTTGQSYRSDAEVHLAKAADGPYVYVTFNEASLDGPASLDRGSAYAGCKLADGSVTPEYDISITKVITAADCPAGSTFVPRTAANAVAATAASTGAGCAGYNAGHTSCLVKYHSHTGKPIWGSVTPQVKAFVPQADGVIAFGFGKKATFDTVSLPMRGQDMIWQSKLHKDTGAGQYVQSIGGAGGGTRIYTAAEDADGNVFAVGYTSAVSGYALDAQSPTYTLPLTHADAFIAIKYGTAQTAVRPPCLGASTCTPTTGNCLISNICYANAYKATDEGVPCLLCDASASSTAWSNGPTVGTTECLIDGACTPANQNNSGSAFTYTGYSYEEIISDCQYCNPTANPLGWTTVEGYNVIPGIPAALADRYTTNAVDHGCEFVNPRLQGMPVSPPAPPGASYVPAVTFSATIAGTVASFDQNAYTTELASVLGGVEAADITLAVSAGSVVVEATILTDSETVSEQVVSKLSGFTAITLGEAVGVTVESKSVPRKSKGVRSFPPPPLPPPPPIPLGPSSTDNSINNGLIAGIVIASIVAVVATVFAIIAITRKVRGVPIFSPLIFSKHSVETELGKTRPT